MTETHADPPLRWPRCPARRPAARPAGAHAVPDPDPRAVRGPRRGGPVDHRGQRRHDPRGGRRRVPRRRRGAAPAGATAAPTSTGERVRFPRGMCRQIVQASAPRQFTQYARNEANHVEIGGMHTVFAPNYGSPFVRDLDNGRRYGTIEDFRNLVKLTYLSPHLHHSGGTVCEPVDVPVNKRHLDMVYSHISYSDKPFMGSVTAPERARDTVEMTPHPVRRRVPRDPPGHAVAHQRQLAAGLGLGHARGGAGLRRGQPGDAPDPVHPGRRDGPGDRGRGGRPDPGRGARRDDLRAAHPARRAGRPGLVRELDVDAVGRADVRHPGAGPRPVHDGRRWPAAWASRSARGGSLCASKVADAQAAYESAATLQPTVLGGVNFVLHAAGWLEGGLAVGYEKFILDADQCGMMAVFVKGVDMSDNGQALDAIRANGPGQHYLGTAHTLANFETAFYRSETADNNSFEQWEEDGSLDAAQRANAHLEADAARVRGAAARPGASTRRCSSSSPGARRRCPTRRSDGLAARPPARSRRGVAGGPADGPRRTRSSSSSRSRTCPTRSRTCRPARGCR